MHLVAAEEHSKAIKKHFGEKRGGKMKQKLGVVMQDVNRLEDCELLINIDLNSFKRTESDKERASETLFIEEDLQQRLLEMKIRRASSRDTPSIADEICVGAGKLEQKQLPAGTFFFQDIFDVDLPELQCGVSKLHQEIMSKYISVEKLKKEWKLKFQGVFCSIEVTNSATITLNSKWRENLEDFRLKLGDILKPEVQAVETDDGRIMLIGRIEAVVNTYMYHELKELLLGKHSKYFDNVEVERFCQSNRDEGSLASLSALVVLVD